MTFFLELFDFSKFMPHGMCFLWRWDLLILHVGSDLLIALAYFSIPAAIYTIVHNRPDTKNNKIALLFVAFIMLCGITHTASIVTVWYPAYIVEGLFKLATAVVSIITAIVLWPLIPKVLSLPSFEQMEARNREIEELNRRLQQRIDSLTTLAGGVSHDFNNMLTVIQGHAQLLERENITTDERASIDAILESTSRAADVCRQMLAYSGRGHFVLAQADLNDIVTHTRLPSRPNLDITYSLGQSVPRVQGAPEQLRQLLVDLYTNAMEATEAQANKGHIEVSTYLQEITEDALGRAAFETDLQPGGAVILQVKDNGTGMSRQISERIFEPYFSTKFTGRGLGMAAVQGIIRGHGGALFIDSQQGQGTTIRVAFPLRSTTSVQYRAPISPHPHRVLVVDDEAEVGGLAKRYLEEMNIEVLITTSPTEALQLINKHRNNIDAVIVDYLMPQKTGTELLEEILAVVTVDAYLTSGYSRGEIDEPQLRKFLTGFIAKPFSREDFRALFDESAPQGAVLTGEPT